MPDVIGTLAHLVQVRAKRGYGVSGGGAGGYLGKETVCGGEAESNGQKRT